MAVPTKRQALAVHVWGVILSIGLFAFHSGVLFLMQRLLRETAGWLKHSEVDWKGPVLILGCFIVLFITHLLEGIIWGAFLAGKQLMDDFGEAVYFSLISFSAVGYGDVVLHKPWRALGAIMAVNGLLLFGCSTAFLFVAMQRVWVVMK